MPYRNPRATPSLVIRVSDESNKIVSHVRDGAGWAVGFVQAKCRQLDKQLRAQNDGRLPPRTFYWTVPAKSIKRIMLKVDVLTQSWFAKIIVGGTPAGILAFPRNVDDPFGWIAPFDTPPGTPNDANADEKRAIYQLQGNELTAIQGQDFREFTNGNLVDWRSGPTTDPDTGERTFEVLHWHAANRYFPAMHRWSSVDSTTGFYEPHFYDKSGTVKVDGPGPDIRGVALRNLGTENEEYVVITGQMATGYTVYVRGRQAAIDDDVMFPWVNIGQGGTELITNDLGSGVVTVYPTVWETPLHFNRAGTRAVKIEMSRANAPTFSNGVPYLLEIEVDGSTVSHTLTNVGTSRTNTSGSAGGTSESTTEQLASPIAADYKADSANDIGYITTDRTQYDLLSVSVSSSSVDLSPPPGQGSSTTTTITTKISRHTTSFNMDGGQGSFTLGPFPTNAQAKDWTYTTVIDLERNVFAFPEFDTTLTIDGTMTFTSNLDLDDTVAQNFSQYLEIQFADIRYGTMVVKERRYVPEALDFNENIDWPATSGGFPGRFTLPDLASPQSVGPVVSVPDTTNTQAVREQVSFNPGFGNQASFVVWGKRNRFLNRTHVRDSNVDSTFELQDEFYATAKFIGSPGIQKNEIFEIVTGFGSGPPVDTPTTVTDQGTRNMHMDTALMFVSPEPQSNVGVVDRNGKFFYSVGLFENDRQSGYKGPIEGYIAPLPDWDHASFVAYGSQDPVETIGMPANETNGPQGDETNTTRPLFGPLIAIQRNTIPEP